MWKRNLLSIFNDGNDIENLYIVFSDFKCIFLSRIRFEEFKLLSDMYNFNQNTHFRILNDLYARLRVFGCFGSEADFSFLLCEFELFLDYDDLEEFPIFKLILA